MQECPKKLLDIVHETIRRKHYSIHTERTYVDWIRRYIIFHDNRHPNELGAKEIESFLTYLAVKRNVAEKEKQGPPSQLSRDHADVRVCRDQNNLLTRRANCTRR